MTNIEWVGNDRIKIDPPKRTKKITGTRFATILGLNPWATDFEIWCAVTHTYEKPFEDTIYTIAGKTIEPKQADYMEQSYGMNLIRPRDVWGDDYFHKTWGDFFPEHKHLGGMWDYLQTDENGEVTAVLEMKTTKRIEDWKDDIPEYYALQAALYAYLYGVDDVIMVASFLAENDYKEPEKYKPTSENTITREFKVPERYPNFSELVNDVMEWWKKHVETGVSPCYDERKDAEILKALRTTSLSPDTNISELLTEAEALKAEIDKANETLSPKESRLKQINEILKKKAISEFKEGDTKVELKGKNYCWTISKSESSTVDKKKLKADGLLEKYITVSPSYRLTVKGV